MKALLIVAVCLAGLAGCATPYQKQSFMGGFDETQLDSNAFRVTFKGNAYTSPERTADYVLLRCAELTLNSGYQYFAVVEAKEGSRQSTFTTPTQSYTTGSATGTAYRSGNAVYGTAYGTAQTTTYGGQTFVMSKPSASNTIVMVKERGEFPGQTFDAKFLFTSLSNKYGTAK